MRRPVIPPHAARSLLLLLLLSSCGDASDHDADEAQLGESSRAIGGGGSPDGDAPGSNCSAFEQGGRRYWFCTNDASWQTARSQCQAIGFDLAGAQSSTENSFIKSKLSADAWLGGRDIDVEAAWRWTEANTQFWQGAANGAATGGAYVNWRSAQPTDTGSQDCLLMSKLDGRWSDETCSGQRDYVCEGDSCPSDPNKTMPGQCGCGIPETDGDGDGTPNCVDECPTDAGKSRRGVCGCGVPDADQDGDGTLNCLDQCPSDPRYTFPGDCGCSDQPAPAGGMCDDGLCSVNTTCGTGGTCGNPQSCKPDNDCTLRYFQGRPYWFCDTDRSFDNARAKCQSKGMDLVVIESSAENAFIAQYTNVHTYIGASDRAAEGSWSWVPLNLTFWTGGERGSAVSGIYENWENSEPDDSPSDDDCAVIDGIGDEWEAVTCTVTRDYVCERADACPDDPNKLQPGQCGCGLVDIDSDGDGSADCVDACAKDPTKAAPGMCGCGKPDADADGDGIANCLDECPGSSDPTAGGTCGCPSAPAPAGTACNDGICGVGVCDGNGHCGAAASTCAPVSGCSCTAVRVDGNAYWFCPCARTHDQAQAACQGTPGQTLLQITTPKENALVAARLSGDTWLAANDRGAEGTWRWATPQRGDNGPRFWDGAATGTAHFGRYTNWLASEPGGGAAANCATISATAATRGGWNDVACSSSAHVICEVGLGRLNGTKPLTVARPCDVLGTKCDAAPDDTGCVPLSQAFAESTTAQQREQFQRCTDCTNAAANPEVDCIGPWPTPTDPVPCAGSAAPPPPGSTCSGFSDGLPAGHHFTCGLVEGSWGSPVQECDTKACTSGQCGLVFSCSDCPADQICPCDLEQDDPQFDTQCPGEHNYCMGRKVCGTWKPECPEGDVEDVPCSETKVCSPDTIRVDETFDDLLPGSDLTPVPASVIEQAFGAPDQPSNATQIPADPACPDEPDPENCASNENHRWCRYRTPQEVRPRDVAGPIKNADSGAPQKVRFYFTPDIDYGYNVYPGPFGLMQFDVGAKATLKAGAEVHVLGANKSFDVVDLLLEARGGLHDAQNDAEDICGISTKNSHITLLETFDILPASFKIALPQEDTQKECIKSVKEFFDAANRAKKAYSDAKELLRQYKAIRAGGKNFAIGLDGLCDQIIANLPFDFPVAPDCQVARPEEMLNHFIDYYYHLALDKLGTEVANRVADRIDFAFDRSALGLDLVSFNNTEEITLVNQTFLIGPIPLNLQILLTLGYGLDLDAVVKFQPSSLIRSVLFNGANPAAPDDPFAYIGAVATPQASAGITLFVGVGFDIGFAAAKVGIEGGLSLGRIGLPIEAGAGIAISAQPDRRATPTDLDPDYVSIKDPPLIPMKKYEISAVYKYGASLKIEDILSGKIDVAVKLKFLFFSKKWRANIARFKGFCTPANPKSFCNIDLFGGYGTIAAIPFEMADWGTALLSNLLPQLKKIPPAQYAPLGSAPFNPGRAGELFFDSLCTCVPRKADVPAGEAVACTTSSECCGYEEGDFCFADPAGGGSTCSACRAGGQSCNSVDDCCAANQPVTCLDDPGDNVAYGKCVPKSGCGLPCATDDDCDDTTSFGDLFCAPASGTQGRQCRRVDLPSDTCEILE